MSLMVILEFITRIRCCRWPAFFGACFLALGWVQGIAYPSRPAEQVLLSLDSISQTHSPASHFARVYLETTRNAVQFFARENTRVQGLMERLEMRFLGYFLEAAHQHARGESPQGIWKSYYADPQAESVQLVMLGVNAHINGDLWQALTTEFTLEEIRELSPYYLDYYKGLLDIYEMVYAEAYASTPKIRLLHTLTQGMDRWYGRTLLKRWRKRQLKLAYLYYTHLDRFSQERQKLEQKTARIDALICRQW